MIRTRRLDNANSIQSVVKRFGGLLGLLVFVFTPLAFANTQSQQLLHVSDDPNTELHLLPQSSVFHDKTTELSFDQALQRLRQGAFTSMHASDLRIFAESGVYWFYFSIKNTTNKSVKLWLELDNIRLDLITLYSVSGSIENRSSDEFEVNFAGDHYKNPQWNKQERVNAFAIDLASREQQSFLMRVASRSSVAFSPRLYADHARNVHLASLNSVIGIIYGVLFAVLAYSINMYLTLKDKTFLYFIAYLFAVMFETAAIQGTLKQLYPNSQRFVDASTYLGFILIISTVMLFLREFLLIRRTNRQLDLLLCLTAVSPVLTIPFYIWQTEKVEFYMLGLGTIAAMTQIYASLFRYKERYIPALFPLVAGALFFLPLVGALFFPSYAFIWLSTDNIFNFCLVIQTIVLALGLSSRIDRLNQKLTHEVSARKRRTKQLMQAQRISKYGDWTFNAARQSLFFSASARAIFPSLINNSETDITEVMMRSIDSELERVRRAFIKAVNERSRFHVEFSTEECDGRKYYLAQAEFLADENGQPGELMVGTIHDITDKKIAEIAQKENENRWRDLADATFEAILIYQGDRIVDANAGCKSILGYSPIQLIGTSGEVFVGSRKINVLLEHIAKGGGGAFEYSITRNDGEEINVEVRCRKGQFNQLDVHFVAIRDVSERARYEEKLRQLGYYDSLTGLANRTLFRERLQMAISRALREQRESALLFIDLDQFKIVNDSLGHDVGDQLLIEVAHRLKVHDRDGNMVARLGGDEFAVLVENASISTPVASIADEVIQLMEEAIEIGGYRLKVTPSIGIVRFPRDGRDVGELLRKADFAMYQAKSEGRNNYQFYTDRLNRQIIQRVELESDLRVALQRQELLIKYQPKVDISSGEVIGAEALLRWQSMKRGKVEPHEFIGVSEETGLIWPIGEMVLKRACEQAKRWTEKYPNFRSIAVNISGTQFNHVQLVETVGRILDESGLPPQYLELEITEGAIINNAVQAIEIMDNLKALGVKLSLDDFGTGFSSLNYLQQFPVDSLKMDRSFLANIVVNETDRRIAGNIINLAHDLRLTVVAEGVEKLEQLHIIRDMECDELQGFLFSSAVTEHELETMLANFTCLYQRSEAGMTV